MSGTLSELSAQKRKHKSSAMHNCDGMLRVVDVMVYTSRAIDVMIYTSPSRRPKGHCMTLTCHTCPIPAV
jgi:hypothetical protein